MNGKNYYIILGVSRDADLETIKRAYRELAKKYHPDKTCGHEEHTERFKEVNEAYQVLSDEAKRAAHDRELAAREAATSGRFISFYRQRPDPFEEAFSIIHSFFRPSVLRPAGRPGAEELELELTLTPAEVQTQRAVELDLPARICRRCGGRGVLYGRGCAACRGSGWAIGMSVRIPVPKSVVSGETRSYRFTTPTGEPLVVHVIYKLSDR